ncbi:MAG: YeeE/YedE family protein [Kangiellaceae bacterium]|nr:YeeE/YedE family protein [Kangiellaceae bacterium]
MKLVVAFISGLLFSIGLTVSQMVDPARVLGFLDITGAWDSRLLYVMGAAFAVFSAGYWLLVFRRTVSLSGNPILMSMHGLVDKQLVIGAVIFGVGWGLTGICPGPAIANLTGAEPKIFVFVAVMILGMKVSELVKGKLNN